jgi:tetratricopeptide (TPR) repeat protein
MYLAQKGEGRIKSLAVLALENRIANVLVSYTGYIGKMLWPKKLACFYPFPDAFPWWQVGGSFFILALISGFAIRYIRQYPFMIVGWLWYLGTLVPVIGFVKIGVFAMADRYSYVPLIGLFVMLAWGVPELLARWQHRRIAVAGLAAVALVICLATTWFQVRVWQNRNTLFTHAVKVTTGNYLAHNELGKQLREKQRFDEAIGRFLESLRLKPAYIPTYINLGYTYAVQNKIAEAIAYYSEAAQKKPNHPQPHQALGILFEQQGELEKSVMHLKATLEIKPENAVAHRYLGNALLAQGILPEAIHHYSESLRIQPANADVHYNLGIALEGLGKTAEAVEQYSLALARNPENADAHYNLANLLVRQQKYERAVAQYKKALAIQPDRIQALNNLAFAYASMQDYEKAISTLHQLARLQADNSQVHYLLSSLYAKQNQLAESIKWLETAFKGGFKNCDLIKTDQDLQNVRSSQDFHDLMSRYCN